MIRTKKDRGVEERAKRQRTRSHEWVKSPKFSSFWTLGMSILQVGSLGERVKKLSAQK
ncbi:hypothetical protein M408DRAFT_301937 [Serendipita vermifera MAFF 305830]|uniref:Uncharacterized protein n=1 Tax=Serendipita vermifera MAFF 305830 TaxID=933852 RepID=A0A0C3ANS9_SERVB|nr:hypothetical protein M408DRAFT_301937 [Serendipita vermifera MAFF 305830]